MYIGRNAIVVQLRAPFDKNAFQLKFRIRPSSVSRVSTKLVLDYVFDIHERRNETMVENSVGGHWTITITMRLALFEVWPTAPTGRPIVRPFT